MEEKIPAPQLRAPKTPFVLLLGAVGLVCTNLLVPMTKQSEGRRYVAYRDIARVLTICDGDTHAVVLGERDTDAQCDARLDRQLTAHAGEVLACTPQLKGRPYQLAAAADLAYNIGGPAYCSSTTARRFKAADWRGGCDAMLAWNKATVNGQLVVVSGLVKRRQRERAVCLESLS